MSKYSAIFFILSVLWIILGYRTIRNDHRDRSYLLFVALCVTMILWTSFLGVAYSSKNTDRIELLLKIAYVGGFLFSPVNLHFFLEISKTKTAPVLLALNYLPSIGLLIANFIDFFLFSRFIRQDDEWYGILASENPLVRLYIAVVLITFLVSFAVILLWNRRTKVNKERIQSRLILIFFTLTYFLSLVSTLILPFFGIHEYQPAGITLFTTYAVGLYFLISRFRLLDLTDSVPAGQIIANVNEFVFILDGDLRIREANRAAAMLLQDAPEKLRNRPFRETVAAEADLTERILAIGNDGTGTMSTIVSYRTESGTIPAKTYVSVMRDRFNDIAGYLVISSEVKEIDRFRSMFRITKRELEIIGLVVSGSSYKDVSEKLRISEKTVERHLTNIYNKIGISNRIELYRIAAEYNIPM